MTKVLERSSDREAIEAEIARIRSLGLDDLRTVWRTTFRASVSPRISWPASSAGTSRSRPSAGSTRRPPDRRLKAGTVLVREYQGERHTVTVVPGGYVWRENTYASLSTIARAITGTTWNGPRFFGLRSSDRKAQP